MNAESVHFYYQNEQQTHKRILQKLKRTEINKAHTTA
jgi:hypothetical protein